MLFNEFKLIWTMEIWFNDFNLKILTFVVISLEWRNICCYAWLTNMYIASIADSCVIYG